MSGPGVGKGGLDRKVIGSLHGHMSAHRELMIGSILLCNPGANIFQLGFTGSQLKGMSWCYTKSVERRQSMSTQNILQFGRILSTIMGGNAASHYPAFSLTCGITLTCKNQAAARGFRVQGLRYGDKDYHYYVSGFQSTISRGNSLPSTDLGFKGAGLGCSSKLHEGSKIYSS